jgi:hypothetical protein
LEAERGSEPVAKLKAAFVNAEAEPSSSRLLIKWRPVVESMRLRHDSVSLANNAPDY